MFPKHAKHFPSSENSFQKVYQSWNFRFQAERVKQKWGVKQRLNLLHVADVVKLRFILSTWMQLFFLGLEHVARVLSDLTAVFAGHRTPRASRVLIGNRRFLWMISTWSKKNTVITPGPALHFSPRFVGRVVPRWARISTAMTITPLVIVRWLLQLQCMIPLTVQAIPTSNPFTWTSPSNSVRTLYETRNTKHNSSPKVNCFNFWAPEPYCIITTDRSRGDIWQ